MSDISNGPVSLNDPISDILIGLIAELRDTGPLESDWHRVEAMFEAVRRAEARLREVTGSDDRPCTAALNIAGKHYPCDTEVLGGGTHRGWPHSNKKAEAIWQGVDDV